VKQAGNYLALKLRCNMKKIGVAMVVVMGLCATCALAAPDSTGGQGSTNQPPKTYEPTQLDLAVVLVHQLFLDQYLPRNPAPRDYFSLLMLNGISLAGPWEADKPVTRADLARAVVLALKMGDKIKDPDNPQAWIDYLDGTGVPVSSIGLATQPLQPLELPIVPTAYPLQTPGTTPPRVLPGGSVQLGAIMQPIRELFLAGPQPTHVTPATTIAPVKGARL
jgi:hypothetical protein